MRIRLEDHSFEDKDFGSPDDLSGRAISEIELGSDDLIEMISMLDQDRDVLREYLMAIHGRMQFSATEVDAVVDSMTLEQTCGACPEAYDVFHKGAYVGHLRLRHGDFTARDDDGNIVYSGSPEGDGIFESSERGRFLEAGKRAIARTLSNDNESRHAPR